MITVYVLVTFADEAGVHKAGTICQVKSEDFDPRFMKKIDNPGGDSYTKEEINDMMSAKQDTLTAGQNITIAEDVISAKDDIGDTVEVTQVQSTGTKIATVKVNNTPTDLYAPASSGDTVEVTQVQSTGTKIATISVNSVPTDLYAPAGGGGGGVSVISLDIDPASLSSSDGTCELSIGGTAQTAAQVEALIAAGIIQLCSSVSGLTYTINEMYYEAGTHNVTLGLYVWDSSNSDFIYLTISRDDNTAPGGNVVWDWYKYTPQ